MRYEGEYKNGKYHGFGKLYDDRNELLYEGEFEEGVYSGEGTSMEFWNILDQMYFGNFFNGKPHGYGTEFAKGRENGEVAPITLFKGQFKNGRRHGNGVLNYSLSDKIFRFGMSHDANYQYQPDNSVLKTEEGYKLYEGEFVEGRQEGYGKIFTYPDGHLYYEGEFTRDSFNGKGMIYQAPGVLLYEGGFRFNKWHGFGISYNKSGRVSKKGYWELGYFRG
ncbi:hypothetical protein ACFYKT_19245 [Cytobacillus sp. FJAT-53684]|uniref:Phosphatidylinositol-4-phosphate 5-kinase n=1 Tax=Cytobacillus mangrovibacter TaxID=3299024 RepID=A0ABW6K6U2_9BACI